MIEHTCKCGYKGPEDDFRSFEECLFCCREKARKRYYEKRGRPVPEEKSNNGNPSSERLDEINLILAILAAPDHRIEGDCFTFQEISSAVGLTKQAIQQIEARAMRKVHYRMGKALDASGIDWREGIGEIRKKI